MLKRKKKPERAIRASNQEVGPQTQPVVTQERVTEEESLALMVSKVVVKLIQAVSRVAEAHREVMAQSAVVKRLALRGRDLLRKT